MLEDIDQHYPFASSLIDEMLEGKHLVYVSDLVLMETISSFRRKISEKTKSIRTTKPSLKKHIEGKTYEFLSTMIALEQDEKIINKNPSVSVNQLHRNAWNYLVNYIGEIQIQGKHYRYKGLNHWDFQHALIAKFVGASVFYTTDNDFKQLEEMNQFRSLNFIISATK